MLKKMIRLFIFIYAAITTTMLTSWSVWHIYNKGKLFSEPVSKIIIDFASLPSKIYHTLSPFSNSHNLFDQRQIKDTSSKDGPVLYADSQYFSKTKFLISTFDSNKEIDIKLLGLRENINYKSWKINKQSDVRNFYKKTNIPLRLHHPLMLKDSSIIFLAGIGGSICSLNKNNSFNWVNSSYAFHHSIELENDSTIWTSIRIKKTGLYKIDGFLNDGICAIDPRNGKIKLIKSIADILLENGYKSLLDVSYQDDAIHLNDIQPASSSSKYWKKGDLMISIRNRSTVALYRPSTNKIIWLKTGPWIAQHDCDFVNEKTIMIFGNDVIWEKNGLLVNGHNDIYMYDFEKDEISKPYTKVMRQANIKTRSEGRCDLLANGDLFVDETEGGKLYIINQNSVKMIYTERYDKNHIKMFNWVRPY